MTYIKACTDGKSIELEVRGHAGYAPKGEDIVCAGISTLVQTMLACLDDYCVRRIKEGYVYISASGEGAINAYKYTVTGLKMIADTYPGYVNLREEGCTIFGN